MLQFDVLSLKGLFVSLCFTQPLDYETKSSYSFTVHVRENNLQFPADNKDTALTKAQVRTASDGASLKGFLQGCHHSMLLCGKYFILRKDRYECLKQSKFWVKMNFSWVLERSRLRHATGCVFVSGNETDVAIILSLKINDLRGSFMSKIQIQASRRKLAFESSLVWVQHHRVELLRGQLTSCARCEERCCSQNSNVSCFTWGL